MKALKHPIRLLNSMSGEKELLETLVPGKLTMYSCGPTVWNFIHIGNLRAALVSDVFFRFFQKAGFDVTFIRNYTDVDDRIIDQSNVEGIQASQLTKRYIQEVEKDYALAGMLEPTRKTLVTEHMPEIVGMIEKILKNGNAYVAPDGEVIYSVDSFKDYGKLSKRNLDEQLAGSRVEVSSKKKNPHDFTLWKPVKPGEPSWPSPWGAGRPGWHIECSAMACKWLGPKIDVHHGGVDLLFPHHENEIAQTEAASKEAPYVRYWVHNAHLMMRKEKMSKSLGNIISARDFLSKFGGEMARMTLLSAHYRSLVDYDDALIERSIDSLTRIYEAKKSAEYAKSLKLAMPDMRAESAWGEFVASAEKAKDEIEAQFANDLNVPGAIAALFTMIREWNRTIAMPRALGTPSCALGGEMFLNVLQEFSMVTGIGNRAPDSMLDELRKMRKDEGGLTPEAVEGLLKEREEARTSKNFARADQIRKELEDGGIVLKDGPRGSVWSYRQKG